MNTSTLANTFKNLQSTVVKHSPEILTGIGIAGMFTTVVLAVKATPKALRLIEDKRDDLELGVDEKLSVVDTVKATWKCYIPAAVTGTAAAACLIGANSVNTRRNAALATAYNLSAAALTEYKEKVVETFGEKKEREVRDKIAEDHLKKNPVNNSAIIVTNNGNTRCFDLTTKRRFTSDIEKINRAVNILNNRMLRHDYVSLNDLYYELGTDGAGDVGENLGWNIRDGLIEVSFSAQLDTDGTPCIVLEYDIAPKRGYDRYM